MLRTMSHEMIHMAKQMSPGYFERYSDFIFDNFLSENDVERIVVAAPIKIGEVDYYMGVMLQRDTQNQRLYLHNVVAVKAEKASSSSQDNSLTNWSGEDESRLFITSILQKAVDVKIEKQKSGKNISEKSEKASIRGGAEGGAEITEKDISVLRDIPRKSINNFTSEEIQKTEVWAKRFYQELGTKSPYFRAWFGDWRAKDKSKVSIISVPTIDISQATLEHGYYSVDDTGWSVYAGKTLNDDTRHHSGGNRVNVKSLNAIDLILKNAVLLDTVVSENDTNKKSANTAFLHKLYTLIQYDGRQYIAKVTVEEYYNESKKGVDRRAYNLKAIKIEPAGGQLGISSSSSRPVTDSTISISNLFEIV